MSLTAAQQQTFKADILANTDPVVSGALLGGDAGLIASWYNTTASPDYWIWKDNLVLDEITNDGFDWVRVDNLTIGKARIWEWMFANDAKSINPSKPNVREGIIETWKGTAADLAVRESIWLHCQTPATRVKQLFSVGSGTAAAQDGTGPATTELTSDISYYDVAVALQS